MRVPSRFLRLLATSVAALAAVTLAPAVPAQATAGNPLTGTWGVHTGRWDRTYPAYAHASGPKKRLYAKVALRPHAAWMTQGDPAKMAKTLTEYIRDTQHGNRNALVQFALFHEWPRSEAKRNIPMTAQEQAGYRRWIDTAVRVIGSTRAMVVLEPDLALNGPHGHTADPAVRLSLVRYAAQRLSGLPRTTVYLEAGAPDWLSVKHAVRLLVSAGVGYTRGFAIGGTHHTSVGADVNYVAGIVAGLTAAGYPGKRAVLDTADNGRPFTYQRYRRNHSHRSFLTPVICRNKRQRTCVTLGVPPTANPTAYARRLRLSSAQTNRLAAYVDAFVWMGRPWRGNNGHAFAPKRLLQAARTTPLA
jgi:endoglucanase